MVKPAAKQNDQVSGMDTHTLLVPSPGGPVPTPILMPFNGTLSGELSDNVYIEGEPAATQGSTAMNNPAHVPTGGPFQRPPSNRGTIQTGSASVLINGKPAARDGDIVLTCNEPVDVPNGVVSASGSVVIGEG